MVRDDNVSEERIESIVRGFGEAFVKRDVEKMLSFFAEDAVWSIIKQVTMQYKGVTGWFGKRLINYIVGRAEEGTALRFSSACQERDKIRSPTPPKISRI